MKWLTIFVVAAGWLSAPNVESAETNLQFTGIRVLTNNEVALSIGFSNGPTYRISTSSELPSWANMVTLPGSGGSLSVTDSAAPYLSQRFYRVEPTPTNALTGDHLTTADGDVVIHPIFHATFVMSWKGKMIYNDPRPVNGFSYSTLPKADLILVSHDHSDHFSASTLNSLTNSNTVIVVSRIVYNNSSFNTSLKAMSILLTNGASANVMGLTVDAVPAYNFSGSTIYHPKGDGNGYILTIGGKRIYIAGDTQDTVELKALRNIDVAFLPMNLPFTMSVTNAAIAVREIRPGVVYPYHYDSGTVPGDVNDFKRRVGQDLGIEVRLRKFD